MSKLNTSSNIKTVWLMIWKIADKKQPTPLKYLSVSNQKITEKKAIADLLAETFSKNSSSQFNTQFNKIKYNLEKKKMNFTYNSAVGPDEIHNEFLKQLPDESVKCLLNIYNNICTSCMFPETWRQSIIVPILKSSKDTSNPQNCQPIALTSYFCKMMEQMINSRLMWYLETNGLITNMQTGFWKRRGTIDHLI